MEIYAILWNDTETYVNMYANLCNFMEIYINICKFGKGSFEALVRAAQQGELRLWPGWRGGYVMYRRTHRMYMCTYRMHTQPIEHGPTAMHVRTSCVCNVHVSVCLRLFTYIGDVYVRTRDAHIHCAYAGRVDAYISCSLTISFTSGDVYVRTQRVPKQRICMYVCIRCVRV